jgi:hypothetical protein
VVAVVRGRLEDRVEVDRGDTEALQVIEALDHPKQITALEAVDRRR